MKSEEGETMVCPCKGCHPPKRHPACHDTCPEYKEWVAPILKDREERRLYQTYKGSDGDPRGRAIRRKMNREKR